MVTVAKVGVGVLLSVLLALQLWVVPDIAAGLARIVPEFGGLRMPGVVLVGILLACVQLALVCVWRLLILADRGRLFEDGSFRWLDAITGLTVSGMVVIMVGCGVIGAAGAGSPFVLIATALSLAAGAALVLLIAGSREVLRDAVTLQDQVSGRR